MRAGQDRLHATACARNVAALALSLIAGGQAFKAATHYGPTQAAAGEAQRSIEAISNAVGVAYCKPFIVGRPHRL